MVAARLDQDDTRTRGFVLDGFPRTVTQADGLDELLKPAELDLALNLVVPTELVLGRLASRRVCVDCGAIYSTSAPPKLNWTCDVCGGEVVQREDDTEEAIKHRLDLYDISTAPLVASVRARGQARRGRRASAAPTRSADALVAVVDAYQHGGELLAADPRRPRSRTRRGHAESDPRRYRGES